MFAGFSGGYSSPGGSVQEAFLNEEGFVHIFQSVFVFSDGRGQAVNAHWSAIEFIDYGKQDRSIHKVESAVIHIQHFKGVSRYVPGDCSIGSYLGEIANPSKQPVCDTGRTP